MTDEQIEALKMLVGAGKVIYWLDPDNKIRRITKVGPVLLPPEEEPEPTDVGWFDNGEYIALSNCSPEEFANLTPVFA